MIPDLDLLYLSLWLVNWDGFPVVIRPFGAAISSIPQNELVLNIGYFIDGDQVVVIVELVSGWEVSVLLALDWHVRF